MFRPIFCLSASPLTLETGDVVDVTLDAGSGADHVGVVERVGRLEGVDHQSGGDDAGGERGGVQAGTACRVSLAAGAENARTGDSEKRIIESIPNRRRYR